MAQASPWGINAAGPYAFGYAVVNGNVVKPDESYQTYDDGSGPKLIRRIDMTRWIGNTPYVIVAPLDRPTLYSPDRKSATLHGAGTMTWHDPQGHAQQKAVTVEAKLEKTSGNAGYISFKVTETDGTVFWDSLGHYLAREFVVQIK